MVGTTKYTDEQIHFVLDRTVRVIPRGDTNKVHDQAVKDFKKRYGVEDFGVNQVRYITERYGSDPLYGNRWANMIKGHAKLSPALLSFDEDFPLPDNLAPSAKRSLQKGIKTKNLLCEHCGGLGTIPIIRPRESQPSFGQQRRTAPQPLGEAPRMVDYSAYRPQSSYRPNPEYPSPTERFPLLGYQQQQSGSPLAQQPVWNTHLRIYDSSSTPKTPTSIGRTDPGTGKLPSRAGIQFNAERPVNSSYSIHQESDSNNNRDDQMRSSHTTTTSVAPQQTSGIPGISINEYAFGREMTTRSSPHYSAPTTMSDTSQIAYSFQSRALDVPRMPDLETSRLSHPSTTSSSTLLGKRQRSTSASNAFSAGNMSHLVAHPQYDWSTSSSSMYTPSPYAGGMSRGTPTAATPGPFSSGSGPSPGGFQEQQRAAKRAKTEDEDADGETESEGGEPPSGDS
ncbi:hypothetical protein HD806DRAFT_523029 [Xylariaceae sp. AK1471]|nr:hypothetical protein HD806DRAFT_523029 [Xylariaceae sp. AK1471]